MTDEEMPPMPVPILAMIPIAISRGVTWIALFDQVEASRGIGRDWLPGTTSICGVRRALVQIPLQPGVRSVRSVSKCKEQFLKQKKFQEKTNTECHFLTMRYDAKVFGGFPQWNRPL
jgi:hypothetical protein